MDAERTNHPSFLNGIQIVNVLGVFWLKGTSHGTQRCGPVQNSINLDATWGVMLQKGLSKKVVLIGRDINLDMDSTEEHLCRLTK
jgi:hypothetical protein